MIGKHTGYLCLCAALALLPTAAAFAQMPPAAEKPVVPPEVVSSATRSGASRNSRASTTSPAGITSARSSSPTRNWLLGVNASLSF
jgi:hypothetical protein